MTNIYCIASVRLDEETLGRPPLAIQYERDVAIADLIASSYVKLINYELGPYHFVISLSDNRLLLDINSAEQMHVTDIHIPLKSLRTLVKDYSLICDSYIKAVENADSRKIE